MNRRAFPAARRQLAREMAGGALTPRGHWIRPILRDGLIQETVVIRVAVGQRPEVRDWVTNQAGKQAGTDLSVEWLFFPREPTAILLCGARAPVPFRFNISFAAGGDRRYLETIAASGILGLTAARLRLGPDGRPEAPVTFIGVPIEPLHDFLRRTPAGAVV